MESTAVSLSLVPNAPAPAKAARHNVITVNPFRCRMWALHDRLEDYVNEQSCSDEITSFLKHGQLVPALGRRVHGDSQYDIELIYGARRLFVARHINRPLMVELRDLNDRDAIVAMDMENRQRQDISPYERGLSLVRWLRSGHFSSQEDLAKGLGLSQSSVSRLLKVGRLPVAILNAFDDPTHICETWAVNLSHALDEEGRRRATLHEARDIASCSPRPAAQAVYAKLLAASARGRKPKPKAHAEVVKDLLGRPLFRIKFQRDSIAVVLPVEKISSEALGQIRTKIVEVLQAARP